MAYVYTTLVILSPVKSGLMPALSLRVIVYFGLHAAELGKRAIWYHSSATGKALVLLPGSL